MKTVRFYPVLLLAALLFAACSGDDSTGNGGYESETAGTDVLSDVISNSDVASFSISLNKQALSETLVVDADDDDYVENTTFDKTVYITFSTSGSATVEGDDEGYVSISGNDVVVNNTGSANYLYVLSGTTSDGFFKLYSSKKQGIRLDGVNITNPDGAALNNQSKKRTFIILADGTQNYLKDGTSYADAVDTEDMKACLFSEGQLVFSGAGYLEVDANCKAGIRSDDYVRFMPGVNVWVDSSAGNGIRGNDAVTVTGGVINVNVTGTASKGISTDGDFTLDGGRTTITTSGTYEYDEDDQDYSACAGVKADGNIVINDGEIYVKSTGIGGKGLNCDTEIAINGGTIGVITTGSRKKDNSGSVSPKGIKCDGNITISGGHIKVRCTGGEGSEGIESKALLTIEGGTVECYCYDDALNSASHLTISGGYVYARATNNDGIDANGNLYINGGVVIAEGSGAPECGLDAAENYKAYINGGTVVAIGGGLQAIDSSSKQASIALTTQLGTNIGLLSGTTTLLAYRTPSSQTGTALMISSPALKSGSSYTVSTGCSVSGGSTFYSLTTGCTVSGGSTASYTASTAVSGSMGGGGGPGGPGGGGW